ncbi:MAG TPA: hypothetical protein PK347_14650 [Burkholderiaceae bacterium]|nr:hypothetical protein [Burkholderiaceae bacterium]
MYAQKPFESFAQSIAVSVPKFDPAVIQASWQQAQDNMKAWGELAQSQVQAAQAAAAETVEAFKGIKDPQAALTVFQASAESGVALFTRHVKAATALSVEQFNAALDSAAKSHPAPEAFAGFADSMKSALATVAQSLDTVLQNPAKPAVKAAPARKAK